MYRRFLTFIKKEKLLQYSDHLLLGVSGGVDSMVLAHLVLKSNFNFAVAHVNYKLRGEQSDADANLVETWCKSHGVPFYLKEVRPEAYKTKKSIQMVARDIRYAFYHELLEEKPFTKMVTAHNANDNLETVLFNLTKGTGISGLTGIAPQKDNMIRPLLFATKEEIYAYAKSESIKWREDQSNAKNDYSRNLIRNEVIPLLKEINPSLEATLVESLIRFNGAAELLKEEKQRVISTYSTQNDHNREISLDWVRNDHKSLLLLSEIIKDYGFHFRDAKDLFQSVLNHHSGALFYAGEFEISLDRGRLFINRTREATSVDLKVTAGMDRIKTPDFALFFSEIDNHSLEIGEAGVAFLNAGLIRYPLKVRNWREGDRFVPLGMEGKKKVSDFMIDSKIPVSLKRKVLVLESQGNILWVIGYRIDDRFKITADTTKILKVEIKYA